jgi:hypothetical protein
MAKRWSKGQPDANDIAFFAHNSPSHSRPNNSNSTPTFRGRSFKRGGRFNNRHQPYTAKVCTYHRCNNTPGHTIEVCRKKQRDEVDARNQEKEDSTAAMATISPETKEKTKASNIDNAYLSSTCFISRCLDDWFADSGATQHMTDQRAFFTTFTVMSPGSWSVKGICSSNLHVCGYGDLDFFVTVNRSAADGHD